jgi:hypothetical protein
MSPRVRLVGPVLALLLVASCSRGGRSSARGECPAHPAVSTVQTANSVKTLNAGVHQLGRRLLPFAAAEVRVCVYSGTPRHLVTGVKLTPPAASRLEATVNRLLEAPPSVAQVVCDLVANAPFYFVTLATGSQTVTLVDESCGYVTNGISFARSTDTWTRQVASVARITGGAGLTIGAAGGSAEAPANVRTRHGLTDQKAPQAHA